MADKNRCLVIGANGFIGSHLVDELIEAGHFVRAFDRFSRQQQFHQHQNIEIVKGDVFDDASMDAALKDIEYVFHCFSATTPMSSDADPYSDISLNVLRNIKLFEQCVEAKIKKIIFLSSGGAVYGPITEDKNVTEDDVPTPISPYGIGKLTTEHYLAYFNRKHELDYIIYRLTNPYGPRQASNSNQGVIPIFINKIKKGQEIEILGDGTSSRDFIYIRDATKMIADTCMRSAQFRTYNIGSGQQTKINTIVEELEGLLDMQARVTYNEAPKTFLQRTQISTKRFSDEFGIGQSVSFEDGLRMTIQEE